MKQPRIRLTIRDEQGMNSFESMEEITQYVYSEEVLERLRKLGMRLKTAAVKDWLKFNK